MSAPTPSQRQQAEHEAMQGVSRSCAVLAARNPIDAQDRKVDAIAVESLPYIMLASSLDYLVDNSSCLEPNEKTLVKKMTFNIYASWVKDMVMAYQPVDDRDKCFCTNCTDSYQFDRAISFVVSNINTTYVSTAPSVIRAIEVVQALDRHKIAHSGQVWYSSNILEKCVNLLQTLYAAKNIQDNAQLTISQLKGMIPMNESRLFNMRTQKADLTQDIGHSQRLNISAITIDLQKRELSALEHAIAGMQRVLISNNAELERNQEILRNNGLSITTARVEFMSLVRGLVEP